MNDSNFDQHIRDKLGYHPSPVDTDAIWSGVQAGMAGKSTRKGGYWKWMLLLLLSLIGGAGGVTWYALESNENSLTEEAANSPAETGQHKESAFNAGTPDVGDSTSHNRQSEPAHSEDNEAAITEREQLAAVADAEREISRQTEEFVPVPNLHSEPKQPAAEKETTKKIPATQSENKIVAEFSEEAIEKNAQDGVPAGSDLQPKINEVEARQADEKVESQPATIPVRDLSIVENAPGELQEAELQQAEEQLAELASVDSTAKLMTDSISLAEDPLVETVPLEKSFFARIDVGAGVISRQLQSLHSDWDAHTVARSSSEKPLEYLSGQILIGYRLPSGIYAATGLSFTQITERFHVDRTFSETDVVDDHVAEIHVDMNGDSSFVFTTAQVEHHYRHEVVEYNRYTLIDLPLIVGYEWSRNKWYLGIEAGVQFNLSLRTNGRMLAPTDEIIEMDASGMYRSNVSVNYLANLRVGYALSGRCQLFLSPGVRFISGSMLQHDVQRQTYQLYGVQVGTRFWLK